MKKLVVALLSLVLIGGLVLSACTPAPAATTVPEVEEPVAPVAEKFKIGILAPAVTHGWVAAVAYNAEQRAKELADEY